MLFFLTSWGNDKETQPTTDEPSTTITNPSDSNQTTTELEDDPYMK